MQSSTAAFLNDITLEALDADPYPIYARLRREAPVAFVPAAGTWFVTLYEDCEAVGTGKLGFVGAKDHPTMDRVFGTPNVLSAEGETHKELRSGVDPKLQPRPVMEVVETVVRPIARGYISRIQARGRGEIMADYMEPVSVEALRHVMGLDDLVSSDVLRRWFHDLNVGNANLGRDPKAFAISDAAVAEINAVLKPKLDHLVANPDESMLSHMLWVGRTPEQGHRPFEMIMPSIKVILLGGMQEPGHAAGSTLLGLFSRPDQWARVQANPNELIAPAVNEGLRWIAPIGVVDRQPTQDVELRGVVIPKGSLVEVVMASANRDESRFDDADTYDLDRAARAHHAFGYGQHFCAGHFFARRVEQIMFEEIVRGLPNLRAEPATQARVTGWIFRAPKHFPVIWDPVKSSVEPIVVTRSAQSALDVPVAVPAPDADTRILRVRALEKIAHSVMKVTLEDPSANDLPPWEAGAHVDLWLKPGRGTQYSLCGDQTNRRHWTIAVERGADAGNSASFIFEDLRPGMLLHVGGPRNHFPLKPAAKYLFIAGGIGITPILPLLANTGSKGSAVELHYCGRSLADMAFLPELEALGVSVSTYARNEGQRADLKKLVRTASNNGALIYVCGPARMREAVAEAAAACGCAVEMENFDPAQAHRDADFAFDVVLPRSGTRLTVEKGETILEALTRAGYHVRQSCKAGNCGSCETPLLSGEADHRDVLLTPSQRAENSRIMVCVSRCKVRDTELQLDL